MPTPPVSRPPERAMSGGWPLQRWSARAAASVVLAAALAAGCGAAPVLGPGPRPLVVPRREMALPPQRSMGTLSLLSKVACALHGARAMCWGENSFDVLGSGTSPQPRPAPAFQTSTPDARALGWSTTGDDLFLLRESGVVLRRYRDAQRIEREEEVFHDVADLATRRGERCVATRAGELVCHPVEQEARRRLAPAPALSGVTAIAGDEEAMCAIHDGGKVTCWGNAALSGADVDTAALSEAEREAAHGTPHTVPGLTDAVHLAMSAIGVCAVRAHGEVVCWGSAPPEGESRVPVAVPLPQPATRVATGRIMGWCALLDGGSVHCWGRGGGQLRAATVPGLTDATDLAVGEDFACARSASAGVVCWGSNLRGQLGQGTTGHVAAPVEVAGVRDAVSVATAEGLSCALDRAGAVRCWGRGRTPLAPGERAAAPLRIESIARAESLVSGLDRVCAMTGNGEARCIEPADRDHPSFEVSPPVLLGPIAALFVTSGSGAAILRSGAPAIAVWSGEGSGTRLSAHPFPGITDAVDAAGCADSPAAPGDQDEARPRVGSVCAVRKTGAVVCADYRIGPGGPTNVTVSEVAGVSAAVAIGMYGERYCAVSRAGDLACFTDPGAMAAGDVPRGTLSVDVVSPGVASVASLTKVTGVACALLDRGAVACGGSNLRGELGTGTFKDADFTVLRGLSGVTSVSRAGFHSCAVSGAGVVHCWGDNAAGQVGDPGPVLVDTPLPVRFDGP